MHQRPSYRAARVAITMLLSAVAFTPVARAQAISPTSFTYQGRITNADLPVATPITLGFTLFAEATGGSPATAQLVVPNVMPGEDGAFSVPLDFASTHFRDGVPRYLELAVIEPDATQVVLSPRTPIRPAPLASSIVGVATLNADSTIDVNQTTGVTNSEYAGHGIITPYQTFTVGVAGVLRSISMRFGGHGSSTMLTIALYPGSSPSGTPLTTVVVPLPLGLGFETVNVDVSTLNLAVNPGDVYTFTINAVSFAQTVTNAAPGASGRTWGDFPINYWFTTSIDRPTRIARAQSAATASSALLAATASTLNATAVSGLNSQELRLRNASDSNHALAWFGGSNPFRNSGVAPDGPVLFGIGGGALGTYNNGTNTSAVALRWNASAQVGIGTAPSSAGYRLELPNTSSPAGQGRANAWITYSSRAYKHNIETISDPLAIVSKLRGVRFDWNADELSEAPVKHDIGFIAEEIAQVLPDLAWRDESGNATGLDYGRVVPVAIEAIKQQQAQIVEQQDQIKTLREQLDRMEQRLNELDRSR